MMSDNNERCGFVTLLGEPNVGKSSLINSLTGEKISIVTHKSQTTRTRIRGIAIQHKTQIIFVDTPGLFKPKRRLDRAMVSEAWSGALDGDIVIILVDAIRSITTGNKRIIKALNERNLASQSIYLLINKIDQVKKEKLLSISKAFNALYQFENTFMISALKGDGLEELLVTLSQKLPLGPWLYPSDQIADFPIRLHAAEITREKLLLRIHEEIPYQLTVEPEYWKVREDGTIEISQVIFVTNQRHKGILLGKNGETIKVVSISSRKELRNFLKTDVHLFLKVKVQKNWQNEPLRYQNIGLNFKGSNV